MPRYQVCVEDLPFALEFMQNPVGYHSPGLQRVLNRMRGPGWDFKYVLIIRERHSEWQLGKLPNQRGAKIESIDDQIYTNILDAERDIFRRRWFDLTACCLDEQLASAHLP